jgi:hypothetical protein
MKIRKCSAEEGVTVRENRDRCDHEDFRFGIVVEIQSRNHIYDRVGDIFSERPWGQHSEHRELYPTTSMGAHRGGVTNSCRSQKGKGGWE